MANIYDMADTWNDGLTTFTAIKMNVTDTASAAGSMLMDLQVGGASKFKVTRNGTTTLYGVGGDISLSANYNRLLIQAGLGSIAQFRAGGLILPGTYYYGWAAYGDPNAGADTFLYRDAANTLAQRNSTNAQTFNLYNTYTDASNYERGFMKWNSNVLQVGAEFAGTGVRRGVGLYGPSASFTALPESTTSGVATVYARNTINLNVWPGNNVQLKGKFNGVNGWGALYPTTFGGSKVQLGRDGFGWPEMWFTEVSSDPIDPSEGNAVMWQSDGTGSGDDGDIMVKVTAGGVTETRTLVDFNAPTVTSDTTQAGANTSVVDNIVTITQADYDAIATPDAATLYVITG